MKTLLTLFLLLFLFSCRQDDNEVLEKNIASVDLYAAGAENSKACYWKNGQKMILPNGDGLYVQQIIAQNNNIYALGGKISEFDNYDFSRHLYLWINGIRHNLDEYLEDVPDPSINSINYSITMKMLVENGDIYFTGSIENPNPTSNLDKYLICSWKNGSKTLIETSERAGFMDLKMINNDLYISAPIKNLHINPATGTYTWENGFYKNSSYSAFTNDITFHGFYNDNTGIYALISDKFGKKDFKNLQTGAILQMPNITQQIFNYVWDGNDKYYVGRDFYYKNNILIQMNDPNSYNQIGLFMIKDQNIYTIRYQNNASLPGLVKVFINNVEVLSTANTSIFGSDVGGILSVYVD
ncbi:hypothetical protein [Chryseobacterium sp. SIMBA_038]|uniref:hypothetical protein n=2 Tax=Pseudomonadati TaxID=3379134 RepID=UPI00397C8661